MEELYNMMMATIIVDMLEEMVDNDDIPDDLREEANSHDCNTCSSAGSCPLESVTRRINSQATPIKPVTLSELNETRAKEWFEAHN